MSNNSDGYAKTSKKKKTEQIFITLDPQPNISEFFPPVLEDVSLPKLEMD